MRDRHNDILDLSRRELMAYAGAAALTAGTALGSATLANAQAKTRFVFANESDYDTVDPHAAFDVGRVAVRLNIYDGLMRWQNNPGGARAVGRGEPHDLAGRAHLHVQDAQGRQVPRRHRGEGAGRRLLARAHSRRRQGRSLAVQDHGRSRRRQGGRRLHRRIQAREAVGDFPLDRAGDPHRQHRAGEEEREERRLGPRPGCRRTRPAPAPTRSRSSIRPSDSSPSASPTISRAGARSGSTRSSSAPSRTPTPACSA